MINTEKNNIDNKPTRAMRDAAMLLLLRRPFRVTVTFCASDKIREPAKAEKRPQEQ
jgi:hypothetical protein